MVDPLPNVYTHIVNVAVLIVLSSEFWHVGQVEGHLGYSGLFPLKNPVICQF